MTRKQSLFLFPFCVFGVFGGEDLLFSFDAAATATPLRPIRPMMFGKIWRAFIRSPQAHTVSTFAGRGGAFRAAVRQHVNDHVGRGSGVAGQ